MDDDEVQILSSAHSGMNNKVELITFNKAHQLQFCGGCNVQANEMHQSIIIKQTNQPAIYAQIGRDYIHVKNMICIAGLKKCNDIIIFFKSEEYCNKIYDFVINKKIKFKIDTPSEAVLKKIYEERFLTPLITEANNTQNERLIEIVQAIQHEDVLVKDIKPASNDDVEDVKDVKPNVVIKVEPLSLLESETTSSNDNNADGASSIAAGNLPNEDLNEPERPSIKISNRRKRSSPTSEALCDKTKDAEPPTKMVKGEKEKRTEAPMKKILYSIDFKLVGNESSNSKELHVYTSSDKDCWYKFLFNADEQQYYCHGCQREKIHINADVYKQLGEYYVVVDDVEHICNGETKSTTENLGSEPSDQNKENGAAESLADVNSKKNTVTEINNNSEKAMQQHIAIKRIMSEAGQSTVQKESNVIASENNAAATVSSQKESFVRDYSPSEIFGPQDYPQLSATASTELASVPTSESSSQSNDSMPILERMLPVTPSTSQDPTPSTSQDSSIPGTTNHHPNVSNANHYRMPMPNSNVFLEPCYFNGTNLVFVPRPVLYNLPMSSPSNASNNSAARPSINVSAALPSTSGNNILYPNNLIPLSSLPNNFQPNMIMSPSHRFIGPYSNHQFSQSPFASNLVSSYQNMSMNSPQANVSMSSSSGNACRPANFNLSSTPLSHNQRPPPLVSFNHSFGTTPNMSQFSTSFNPNGMLYNSNQTLSQNPTVSNANTTLGQTIGSNVLFSTARPNVSFLSTPAQSSPRRFTNSSSSASNLQPLNLMNAATSSAVNFAPTTSVATERNIQSNSTMTASNISSTNSHQNMPSYPTSSGTQQASNVSSGSKLVLNSDRFSLGPNKKGVPDTKLEVHMPCGQIYVYTWHQNQNAFVCKKCEIRGGKTTATVSNLPSGEMSVTLDENKHCCTMPYSNETLLYHGYEIIKNDDKKAQPFLVIFDAVNMELGYEFYASGNKFICKNCERLKKHVTARICVDQHDKQCIAFYTDRHECKMINFVESGKIVKAPYYLKRNTNGQDEVIVYYEMKQRKFIRDAATNSYYCEGCRNSGRNTRIKIMQNQNGEEFVLACGTHWCNAIAGLA